MRMLGQWNWPNWGGIHPSLVALKDSCLADIPEMWCMQCAEVWTRSPFLWPWLRVSEQWASKGVLRSCYDSNHKGEAIMSWQLMGVEGVGPHLRTKLLSPRPDRFLKGVHAWKVSASCLSPSLSRLRLPVKVPEVLYFEFALKALCSIATG